MQAALRLAADWLNTQMMKNTLSSLRRPRPASHAGALLSVLVALVVVRCSASPGRLREKRTACFFCELDGGVDVVPAGGAPLMDAVVDVHLVVLAVGFPWKIQKKCRRQVLLPHIPPSDPFLLPFYFRGGIFCGQPRCIPLYAYQQRLLHTPWVPEARGVEYKCHRW